MNSSFFRTTFSGIFISVIFIILFFSSIINSLSYNTNVSINNSNISIPKDTIITFSSSRVFMAYSSAILQLLHSLAIEMHLLLVLQLFILALILVLQHGTNIVAIFSGTVTYLGFSGAGGYTITVKNQDFSVSYCHVSPNFLISVGEYVLKRYCNWKCWSKKCI